MPHTIAALSPARHMGITQALRDASTAVGADFDYLLDTAARESSLNPKARARTSSASGLFQFTGQTWLGMVKRHGSEHGLSAEAASIQVADGRYQVPDPLARQAILALRNDPKTASLMAGELTAENRRRLESQLERPVSDGELYTAHVMGAGGAAKLISAAENNPAHYAAKMFPEAAQANHGIFFEANGKARSVAQVVNFLTERRDTPPPTGAAARLARAVAPDTNVASLAAPNESPNEIYEPQWTPATRSANGAWTGSLRGAASSAGNLTALGHSANILSPSVIAILASLDAPESHQTERQRTAPQKTDGLS